MRAMAMKRVLTAALLAILLAGCGEPERDGANAPARQPTTRKADAPAIPEEFQEELTAGRTDILIDETAGSTVEAPPSYIQQADYPSGRLSGVCRFVGPVRRQSPPAEIGDAGKGEYAITDPMPGEVEYYNNIQIRRPQFYRSHPRMAPTQVALIFRDVKVGSRRPLLPGGVMSIHGYVTSVAGNHSNRTPINFAPPNARVTFFTYEAFPCTFILSRVATGRQIFSGRVTYKDKGAERKTTVGGGHQIWIASKPDSIQSPILTEMGRYRVSTRRHPWKVGHLFVVDNPYVEVVGGSFDLKGIPVGRHRMEVWHPAYKVLKTSYEFEIVKDEVTEVAIDVVPPPEIVLAPKKK